MLTVASTALASIFVAIITAFVTYLLTRRRDQEADWRKLKLDQYKEFILALSGIVGTRSNEEAQQRYADAVNSMNLVASLAVLRALNQFQREISYLNRNQRSDERHDELLNILLHAMRADIQPSGKSDPDDFAARLLDVPPKPAQDIT